ncbi:MAG: Gfo/Idh/MocA family oxidoreductase [Atopobiaceae bacterium]|nr:Gfo/Idh/MocA family oxidoreductase [Atopobiaceae bacterium]
MGKSGKIGVGILGTGNWTMYGHVPVLKTLEGTFERVAILDPSQERADQAAAENGFARGYSDIDELLADPDVDIVFVNTPGPLHYQHAKKVIEAGKDVYCEWPLGTTVEEAEDLLNSANAKGLRTIVGMQRSVAPAARYMHDLIANGYVGEINAVSLRVGIDAFGVPTYDRWKWYTAPDSFTNPVTIYAAHFVELLQSIVGPLASVDYAAARKNFDEFDVVDTGAKVENTHPTECVVVGRLANGALVNYQVVGGQQNITGVSLEVSGSDGALRMENVRGFQNVEDNWLSGCRGEERDFHAIEVPEGYRFLGDSGLDNSAQDLGYNYMAYAEFKRTGKEGGMTFAHGVDAARFVARVLEGFEG